jgi:hypothetical protein
VEALFVERSISDKPQLDYYDPEAQPPVVLIDGTQALRLERLPGRGDPYLTFVELPKFFPDRFNNALEAAMQDLFSGADPAAVQQALLEIQETPGLLCTGTWSCDRYYYILGLASELAGDEKAAVEAYTRLWWDYSISPYTSMARLKLSGAAVQPSATPSPTGAPTAATTLTPTVSGTPATATPTITGTPPTATPTGGTGTPGTPGASATVTLTPTPGTPYP